MKNIEKWRLIVQEAKAHPELKLQGEGSTSQKTHQVSITEINRVMLFRGNALF
jgi:hypothetical protein